MKIEGSWEKLSIGLHAHRYYLHIRPYLASQINKKINSWDLTSEYILNKYEAKKLNGLSEFLLHDKKWMITEKVCKSKFESALNLIEKVDYSFFPILNTAIISDVSEDKSYEILHLKLDFKLPTNELAQNILENSATSYLLLYLNSLNVKIPDEIIIDPVYNEKVSQGVLLCRYFSKCVIYNFLYNSGVVNESLRLNGIYINKLKTYIDDILAEINHMNIEDLITLFTPESKRFQKYWDGMGAGQS